MSAGTEITVLALGGLLLAVQFGLMAVPANLQLGPRATMGPRDEPLQLTGIAGRLHRALGNMTEALVLYGAAAVSVTLSDAGSAFTATCAWVWLAARVVYVPCYAFGLSPWRSLCFAIGFAAAVLMLIAALV
ncbi:MAPEG family protein [Oceanicella sp. SM1341]|uniref:MAPEG family protein n=1 Tax=Oceanicella sp. SM1341 TaxID=1548889 RepID=UPI001E396AF8|nr:MAPEG family protein [Oceanicella sp. SM1341]